MTPFFLAALDLKKRYVAIKRLILILILNLIQACSHIFC